MCNLLNRLSDFLDALCKKIGGVLLAAMVFLIVIQVVARYVAGSSLSWSEEISRYLFIWVVMFGTVIGVHDGSHVAVEFLLKRLPATLYRLATIGYTLCLCVLAVVMSVYGSIIASDVYRQLSPATRVPMTYVYAAVPICSAIMLVHLAAQLTRNLSGATEGEAN